MIKSTIREIEKLQLSTLTLFMIRFAVSFGTFRSQLKNAASEKRGRRARGVEPLSEDNST